MTFLAVPKIVVLACGNIFAGDDAVGIEVMRELEREGLPASVTVVEAGAPGLGMLDHMFGFDKAVIIDAVVGAGEPGRIVRWREDEIPRKMAPPVSVHDISIRDALEFGRKSVPGMLPSEVVVIGVVVAQMEAWHMGLTPEVAEAVPGAARAVRTEIDRWVPPLGARHLTY